MIIIKKILDVNKKNQWEKVLYITGDILTYEFRDGFVINIIENLQEHKVVLIGVRVESEKIDWSVLMEEFDVNELLERKMVSLLFFKIGVEYRLEIYDQLKVMLNTIKTLT